jgi:hypothetical protein
MSIVAKLVHRRARLAGSGLNIDEKLSKKASDETICGTQEASRAMWVAIHVHWWV